MTTRTGPRAARLPAALAALAVLAVLALTLLLAGCGSEDDAREAGATSTATDPASLPAPSSTTSSADPAPSTPAAPAIPAGTPDCAEVWVTDATLPRGYGGCVEDGALVKADRLGCESGQAIVRYADRFYGVAGGTVHEAATSPLLDDPDYTDTVARCRA